MEVLEGLGGRYSRQSVYRGISYAIRLDSGVYYVREVEDCGGMSWLAMAHVKDQSIERYEGGFGRAMSVL
jgi:hypothetical protein